MSLPRAPPAGPVGGWKTYELDLSVWRKQRGQPCIMQSMRVRDLLRLFALLFPIFPIHLGEDWPQDMEASVGSNWSSDRWLLHRRVRWAAIFHKTKGDH